MICLTGNPNGFGFAVAKREIFFPSVAVTNPRRLLLKAGRLPYGDPELLVSIQIQTFKKKKSEQSFCFCVSWTVASVLFCTPPFPFFDLITCRWHT